MKFKDYLMRGLKKTYRLITNKKFENPKCDINRQSANDKIYELLCSREPCMISRFGTVEINAVNNYICINSNESFSNKIWNYISDKTHLPWWNESHFDFMNINAGIFPPNKETADKLCILYLKEIPKIDLLGSFQYYEKFMPLRADVQNVHLETLYPFFVNNPWTRALKDKKVLVVHPFEETIQVQYKNRKLLFDQPNILPDFELITMKAIQSAAGITVPFNDWFEALRFMENKISELDFDICILGCGAYGLPLAAHIKDMGKKAVHLGGGTQLLFGIKGKRWENPSYGKEHNIPSLFSTPYMSLYNDNWVRPFNMDTPKTAKKIEDACYW